MNEVLIDQEQARVLDILEQVKKLNQMIAMHESESKDTLMANQYRDMKNRFLLELKQILSNYEVEVLLKEQAA
jgi:hypothetical protein